MLLSTKRATRGGLPHHARAYTCLALNPRNPAKLKVSLEHVRYEMVGLLQACGVQSLEISMHGGDVETLQLQAMTIVSTLRNAAVELRGLHARNMIEFLLCLRRKHNNDLNAHDYLPEFEVGEDMRERLMWLYRQACAQVSHLTVNRVTDAEQAAGKGSKSWRMDDLVTLLQQCRSFALAMCESAWATADQSERTMFYSLATQFEQAAADLRRGAQGS